MEIEGKLTRDRDGTVKLFTTANVKIVDGIWKQAIEPDGGAFLEGINQIQELELRPANPDTPVHPCGVVLPGDGECRSVIINLTKYCIRMGPGGRHFVHYIEFLENGAVEFSITLEPEEAGIFSYEASAKIVEGLQNRLGSGINIHRELCR